MPATDGLFLGETVTPRRWDGSKLINLSGSQMPDVLLLNGSRAMTGDLNMQTNKIKLAQGANPALILKAYDDYYLEIKDSTDVYLRGIRCSALKGPAIIAFSRWEPAVPSVLEPCDIYSWDGVGWQICLHAIAGVLDIPRARDITFLDDGFLKIGKDSDGTLPTASADYQGKMIRVEGGAGVADKLYICMKKADDTYDWIQIASG